MPSSSEASFLLVNKRTKPAAKKSGYVDRKDTRIGSLLFRAVLMELPNILSMYKLRPLATLAVPERKSGYQRTFRDVCQWRLQKIRFAHLSRTPVSNSILSRMRKIRRW